jgi:hypothetical protein
MITLPRQARDKRRENSQRDAFFAGILTLLGANSWFLPLADVGMPANGVCWTITTMSFFYWTFPWLLPRMQEMTAEARNRWIIWSYWIQLVSYFGLYLLYSTIPVLQFRGWDESGGSAFVLEKSPSMGYWVARAWPGTRIFVFAMGCLAALNRLEVRIEAPSSSSSSPPPLIPTRENESDHDLSRQARGKRKLN